MNSLEVTCIISGVSRKLFGDYLLKKISDYGSADILLKSYVAREARGLLRQGLSPEEVQKKLLPRGKKPFPIDPEFLKTLDLPIKTSKAVIVDAKPRSYVNTKPVEHTSLESWIKWATGNALGGTCIRPDIRCNQNRCCDGCEYFEFCQVTDKKLMR